MLPAIRFLHFADDFKPYEPFCFFPHLPQAALESRLVSRFCEDENGALVYNRVTNGYNGYNGNGYNGNFANGGYRYNNGHGNGHGAGSGSSTTGGSRVESGSKGSGSAGSAHVSAHTQF